MYKKLMQCRRVARKLTAPTNTSVVTRALTVDDLCERLSICRASAYAHMNRGELAYFRVGSHRRVTEAALEAFIASKTVHVA